MFYKKLSDHIEIRIAFTDERTNRINIKPPKPKSMLMQVFGRCKETNERELDKWQVCYWFGDTKFAYLRGGGFQMWFYVNERLLTSFRSDMCGGSHVGWSVAYFFYIVTFYRVWLTGGCLFCALVVVRAIGAYFLCV